MPIAKRIQLSWLAAFGLLVFVAAAAGQDLGSGGDDGTNQPASTNEAYVPPSVAEQLQPQPQLPYEFGIPSNRPPPLGPAIVGSAQPLTTPILGTSALPGVGGLPQAYPTGPGIPLWGPIDIHPRLTYTFSYGDGISYQPGQQAKTIINTVTPGALVDFGPHWSLDYSPAIAYYSSKNFKDTVDESITLRGNWEMDDWFLSLSQNYIETRQPLLETGGQTAQEAYTTAFNASRQLGSELSAQFTIDQNFRDAAQFTDLKEWTAMAWLNYQPVKTFGAGLGLTLGYDDLDPGSSMPYEEIQGRLVFQPSKRLMIAIIGGGEDRQFIDPSAPPMLSPTYSGSLSYQVLKPTYLTANLSQTITPSFYNNEVETVTSYAAAIHQTITAKISFDASVGYTTEPLTSIVPGALPSFFFGLAPRSYLQKISNQEITSYRISLNYNVLKRVTVSAFYAIVDNNSGEFNLAYITHQVGLSLRYVY